MDDDSLHSLDPALMGMLDDEIHQMERYVSASHTKHRRQAKHQRQIKHPRQIPTRRTPLSPKKLRCASKGASSARGDDTSTPSKKLQYPTSNKSSSKETDRPPSQNENSYQNSNHPRHPLRQTSTAASSVADSSIPMTNPASYVANGHATTVASSSQRPPVSTVQVRGQSRQQADTVVAQSTITAPSTARVLNSNSTIASSTNGTQMTTGAKGKTYTADELLFLAKAWMKISEDGATGNDQQGETFWSRVHEAYNNLLMIYIEHNLKKPKKEKKKEPPARNVDSLKNTWSTYQKAWQKFGGICATNPAGTGENNLTKFYEARIEMYEEQVPSFGNRYPAKFKRLLPGFLFLQDHAKFGGWEKKKITLAEVDDPTQAPKLFTKRNKGGGRDSTKNKRLVQSATNKATSSLLDEFRASRSNREKRREKVDASILKLVELQERTLEVQVMQTAPEKERSDYFATQRRIAGKRQQLEEAKLDEELKKIAREEEAHTTRGEPAASVNISSKEEVDSDGGESCDGLPQKKPPALVKESSRAESDNKPPSEEILGDWLWKDLLNEFIDSKRRVPDRDDLVPDPEIEFVPCFRYTNLQQQDNRETWERVSVLWTKEGCALMDRFGKYIDALELREDLPLEEYWSLHCKFDNWIEFIGDDRERDTEAEQGVSYSKSEKDEVRQVSFTCVHRIESI